MHCVEHSLISHYLRSCIRCSLQCCGYLQRDHRHLEHCSSQRASKCSCSYVAAESRSRDLRWWRYRGQRPLQRCGHLQRDGWSLEHCSSQRSSMLCCSHIAAESRTCDLRWWLWYVSVFSCVVGYLVCDGYACAAGVPCGVIISHALRSK